MSAKSAKAKQLHPAEQYARDVVAGRIVACKWVVLACKRHISDLAVGAKRGLHFDEGKAAHAIGFFRFLVHSKGEWAGQEILLEPWQQFVIWCVFGWRKADGTRRFRVVHEELARKNGKSTKIAGIALYCAFFDGEPGAEAYCAATKKDQARIVFEEAVRMRDKSPHLTSRINKFRDNLCVPATASKLQPLGADEDTLDGLSLVFGSADELHAWKKRLLWDVLDTATGARRQALLWAITTAGFDRDTVCWSQHEYAEKVLDGIIADDSFFAYIATLDQGDDHFDERNWPKANPNLGVSVKIDDMRRQALKAKNDPSALNSFLRLRLNVWTSSETAAIKADAWKQCVGPRSFRTASEREVLEHELEGRVCFVGDDLSSTEDIAAHVRLFPPLDEDDPYIIVPDFFLPQENIDRKIAEHRAPYDVWVREGWITATDGNVIDYKAIRRCTVRDFERYQTREIAYDPWNATQYANDLQEDGVPAEALVKFSQTFAFFAEPTKLLLEVLIPNKRIAHLDNPPLRWMASNLLVKEDNNGNRRPIKGTNRGKVDGMVALIMALGRAIASPGDGEGAYSAERGAFRI